MRLVETITHTGQGYWDGTYYTELVHVQRTQSYRFQTGEWEKTFYEVRYRRTDGALWQVHRLQDEAEREQISAKMTPKPEIVEASEGDWVLDHLARLPLTAFAFHAQGITLTFGGDVWNTYTLEIRHLPIVTVTQGTFTETLWGYADAIRALVGEKVAYADDYRDAGVILDFEAGQSLHIPLEYTDNERSRLVLTCTTPNNSTYTWMSHNAILLSAETTT